MRLFLGLLLRAAALALGIATLILAANQSVTFGRALIMLTLGHICLCVSSLEHFTRGVKLVPREDREKDGDDDR